MLERLLTKIRELTCVHFIDDFIIDKNGFLVCRCKKCGKHIYYENDSFEYHYIMKDGLADFWED